MNFLLTILGWVAWNWFEFTQAKDAMDEKDLYFDWRKYVSHKWDNWGWTAIVATGLLLIGHAGLGLEFVKSFNENLEWSDLWYLGSGVVSEMLSYGYKRIIKRRSIVQEMTKNEPPKNGE